MASSQSVIEIAATTNISAYRHIMRLRPATLDSFVLIHVQLPTAYAYCSRHALETIRLPGVRFEHS